MAKLTDKLSPADPAPTATDEVWLAEIRARVSEYEEEYSGVVYEQFLENKFAKDIRHLLDALDDARRERDAAEHVIAEVDSLSVLSSTAQYMNGAQEALSKFILEDPDRYHRIMNAHHVKESDHADE